MGGIRSEWWAASNRNGGRDHVGIRSGGVIAFAAAWATRSFGLSHDARVLFMALAAALAWTLVFATLSFRNSDEFRQQGSMIAWYWGGAGGLAVAAPVYVFVLMGGLVMIGLEPRLAPAVGAVAARSFMMGFLLPVLLQLVGFFAVRTWWGLSKR